MKHDVAVAAPRGIALSVLWIRILFETVRRISLRQWLAVAALSAGWALANLFSHVVHTPPEITRWDRNWYEIVAQFMLTGLMLFVAIRLVEHRGRPTVTRYLWAAAVTLLLAVGIDFLVFYVLAIVPAGFYGNTPQEQAVHRVVAMSGLLFLEGGFGVLIYARLRSARMAQAAFAAAELERTTSARQVLVSRLSALQAQVEPRFLFNALAQVEALYDNDRADGDRMLDQLIAYLRAAIPRLRAKGSTLKDEVELAHAYLSIVQVRMGSRLIPVFDVPSELRIASFPPMVLLPLVDNALRHGLESCPVGGRISVRAQRQGELLQVEVADDGVGHAEALVEGRGLVTLRERLKGLYADKASLTLASNRPRGIVAIVSVPHEIPPDPH